MIVRCVDGSFEIPEKSGAWLQVINGKVFTCLPGPGLANGSKQDDPILEAAINMLARFIHADALVQVGGKPWDELGWKGRKEWREWTRSYVARIAGGRVDSREMSGPLR